MDNQHRRVVGFLALLLAVWIGVYWLYNPTSSRITWGERPSDVLEAPPLVATEPIVAPEPSARQAVQEPRFRAYTVQKGDVSFEAVARRFAGGGSVHAFAEAISRANPLATPDRLIVGRTRLRIPEDPSNTQGRIVAINPDGTPDVPAARPVPGGVAALPAAGAEAQPRAGVPAAPREYVVQPGDTLSGIAKKMYGRVALWPLIAGANGMDEATRLKPGMKLKVPAEPKGD